MSITRGELKYQIWLRLNKSATTKGFYTDEKVNSVIQECLDYINTEQFLADEGFTHKLDHLDVEANQVTIPIRPHWAMILEVRYLIGTTYVPLTYDQQWGAAQSSPTSGVVQSPASYKIVDNMFYFNPAIGVGGTNYLQVEYMAYPPKVKKDSDYLPTQFDRCMYWFTIYHSCELLAGQVKSSVEDWPQQTQKWYQKLIDLIGMRTRQAVPIVEFTG